MDIFNGCVETGLEGLEKFHKGENRQKWGYDPIFADFLLLVI